MTTASRTAGRWELFRALGALAEQPSAAVGEALSLGVLDRADHTQVFAFHALPYASAYLGTDGMLGGEAAARVSGFWAAVGYSRPDAPDHLAGLLGLYAALGEREAAATDPAKRALLEQSRAALLWEHLLPWTGVFCDLVRRAAIPPWSRWADLLEETLREEWTEMAAVPEGIPRHLHDAPPALGPSLEISDLLVPLRAGMIVTRADLVEAARSLGLGIRLTGRLPSLQALLGPARREVIGWLSDHALRWEGLHRARSGPSAINHFWAERAANAAAVLAAILAEA